MKKLTRTTLVSLLALSGATFFACSNNPEAVGGNGGDGDSGDGDGNTGDGDGDISLGDGDGDTGDGDGDTGDGDAGDGDTGLGGSVIAPDWEYPDDITFDYTPITGGGQTCGSVTGTPDSVSRPIDIIFVVDNSGSMSSEIQDVEENIYSNFANIIAASDIDYRVIMISRYGSSTASVPNSSSNFGVCIPTPLGGHDCVNPMTKMPVNGARFFHYSADVDSQDSLCVLLESYDEEDEFAAGDTSDDDNGAGPPEIYPDWTPLAPDGWQQWLRPEAFKTFVVVTDDDVYCDTDDIIGDGNAAQNFDIRLRDNDNTADGLTAATRFDEAILALSPSQFGTEEERNYVFHSIIGLNENNPAADPWEPTDTVVTSTCDVTTGGDDPPGFGTGYQQLSRLTGGLRYPICVADNNGDFNPIFDEIAQGVIEDSAIPCEYDFPEVDGIINPDNIVVNYTPSGGGAAVEFTRVTNEGACTGGDDFYFDSNTAPTKLFLCGSACTTVQADGGDLELDFGCLGS